MDPRIFFDGLFFSTNSFPPPLCMARGSRLVSRSPHGGTAWCTTEVQIMESWTVSRTRHVMHPEEVQNCIVIPHTLGSQCSVQRVIVMGHVVCSAPFEARVRCCAQMLQSHTKQAGKAAQQQHGDASDARPMRARKYARGRPGFSNFGKDAKCDA